MRGQRRRRRAALPGADGRGRRGPAVHRAPAGDPRQRGHRPGRPDRAADRRRGRRRRSQLIGLPGGAHPARAGGHRTSRWRPSPTPSSWRSTPPSPTYAPGAVGPVPAAPARRPLRRRQEARPRQRLPLPHDDPHGVVAPAVRPRRRSSAATTTSRPTTAPSGELGDRLARLRRIVSGPPAEPPVGSCPEHPSTRAEHARPGRVGSTSR